MGAGRLLQVLTVRLLIMLAVLLLLLLEELGLLLLLLLLLKELARHVRALWHGHMPMRCIRPPRQARVLSGLGKGTPVGEARHHGRRG